MYERLRDRGVQVLAIGVSDQADAARIATTMQLPFPVLADRDRTAYDAYVFGTLAFVLQKSGTVLVERGGQIRMLHRALNPGKSLIREELESAVAAVTGGR